MRYVILRDDDTNALTPVECLEKLYRPFLEKGFPVNLAVIPEVATGTRMPNGEYEGYLPRRPYPQETVHLGANSQLVRQLLQNPGYHVVQHGCHHDWMEFDVPDQDEAAERMDRGSAVLQEAGFAKARTFVAPYDRFSKTSLEAAAARYRVISTGWFEWRRIPVAWWPDYLRKKWHQSPHWQVGNTFLLSHPGCLLSCNKPANRILDSLLHAIASQPLTVVVTHWWEYFRAGEPDNRFIGVLHEFSDYLSHHPEVKPISFTEFANGGIPLS